MPDVHEKAESVEPPSNNSDVALPNKELGDISMERCFHSRLNFVLSHFRVTPTRDDCSGAGECFVSLFVLIIL